MRPSNGPRPSQARAFLVGKSEEEFIYGVMSGIRCNAILESYLTLEEDVTINAFVNQALENEVSKHHVGP